MTVPTSKCIPILLRPTIAILCFLLTHLSFDVLAQDICENPVEEVNGFVPPQEYSPEVVIRIDRLSKFPNRDSAAVLCININTPGLYRIKTTIEYSLGTEQNNESFFMHVTNSSNKVIDPCNPNLGPHRVIVPDPTQANKTIIERDAGVFPFTQGINIISFVHYYRIHDRKPEYGKFVNGKFDTTKIESVKLLKLILEPLPTCPTRTYDLRLTKSVSPAVVSPGQEFNYSMQIANLGPDKALNINLTDLLPDSIFPKSFTMNPPVDLTARPLEWRFEALDSGEVVHIEFSAIFPDSFDISADSLQKSNTSYIDADFDTNTQNDTALAVVTIKKQTPAYDLVLTKKVNPSTIVAGEIFTYSLQIRNNGPDTANNIRLTDLLPDSIYPVNFITDMPIDPTARILKWQLKPLAFGEVVHIEFSAIFPDSFDISADSLQKSNTSYIDADFDTNTQNDTALAVVTIKKQTPAYDLVLTKKVNPSTIVAGEIFTYSLQIRNNGPDTANNIRLTDLLPDSIYPVNFITDMPIDPTARILNWDLTSLDSGAIKNIEFTATFMDSLGSTTRTSEFINTSFVGAPFDKNTQNDTARAQISVLPRPPNYDLILTKAVSRDTVVQGQTFSYTLEITNNGPEAVPGFSVWDAFPGGLSLSDFSLQPIDAFAADTLRWQIEQPLLPGEKIAIVYTGLCPVVSNFTNPQTQINTARVIGENDSDPTNNSATASVVCLPPTDSCDAFVNLDRSLFKPDDQTPLAITVELDVITDVSLDIFDIAGYPIKRISTTNATVGLNTFFWDGQTNEGLKAGSGVYIVVVRDKVISGQILECIKKVLVVR